jgi:mono/diheme cytochrome c family protein
LRIRKAPGQWHRSDLSLNELEGPVTLKLRLVWCSVVVILAMPNPGHAADANNGARLALRWCEACHVVAPSQLRSSTDVAPPFATIASRPDFDAGQLALFLLEPHPKMPSMSLSRIEAADLAAYIKSLAKSPMK